VTHPEIAGVVECKCKSKMDCATLIASAELEVVLDVEKPMQTKKGNYLVRYLTTDNNGKIIVQYPSTLVIDDYWPHELENVPRAKHIATMPDIEEKLDFDRPIRLRVTKNPIDYIAHDDTKIVFRDEQGSLIGIAIECFENVPAPKRTLSREIIMIEGFDTLVMGGLAWGDGKIIARKTVTLTEGDGIEEK